MTITVPIGSIDMLPNGPRCWRQRLQDDVDFTCDRCARTYRRPVRACVRPLVGFYLPLPRGWVIRRWDTVGGVRIVADYAALDRRIQDDEFHGVVGIMLLCPKCKQRKTHG